MAKQIKITVDKSQVENFAGDFREMAEVGLRRIAERGTVLLRREVPKVTHNLEQGVSVEINASGRAVASKLGRYLETSAPLKAEFIVSARSGRTGVEGGLLHLPSGATREVTLRPQPAHDYARDVAEGTGVYNTGGVFGPQPYIRPRSAQALLIPVGAVPPGINGKPQAYITSNGKIYILRRWSRGRKANPYHERAAAQLETDAPAIWDRVVSAFANQEKES